MPEFRRFPSGQDALSQATLNDNTLVPCRYQEGTANDSDKSIPFSILNSTPVAVCNSSADSVQKVATVDNFPDFTLTNGREVSVYFANGNTATSPSFNLNNTGAMALGLENQASSVSIGSGCWGGGVWLTLKYVDITVAGNRIQKWIIKGHDVASISNGVTTKADGTTVYNTQSVDNAFTNHKKPSVNRAFEQESGVIVLRNTLWILYGGYDTANYHYFKYLVIDSNGNTLTEFVRYKSGENPTFAGGVSNGISRTSSSADGTLNFSSISKIYVWEIPQTDFEKVRDLDNRNIYFRSWINLGDNTYISLAQYIQSLKSNGIIKSSFLNIILHSWSFAVTPRITELGSSLAGATVKVIYTDNVSFDMEICTNTGGATQHLWRYHENGNDYKVLKQVY